MLRARMFALYNHETKVVIVLFIKTSNYQYMKRQNLKNNNVTKGIKLFEIQFSEINVLVSLALNVRNLFIFINTGFSQTLKTGRSHGNPLIIEKSWKSQEI